MRDARWLSLLWLVAGMGCAEVGDDFGALPGIVAGHPNTSGDSSSSGPSGAGQQEAAVKQLELSHLSEQRPAWVETRSFEGGLSASQALDSVHVAEGEVVAAVLRDGDGEIVDAQFRDARDSAVRCRTKIKKQRKKKLVVPTDYPTIQAAIDAAQYGDKVRVLAGTYHEHLRLRSGVRLIGAGAQKTILDGDGMAINLIDFTDARDAVVSGFTLRGVAQAQGCGRPKDPLACSGDWYAAAVYADGHAVEDDDPCNDPSLYFSDNIVTGNDTGMMLYFHPFAVVRDNVFTGNRVAFAASSHGGGTSLLVHNVFYDNSEQAVAVSASFMDIVSNVFLENGSVLRQENCQRGRLRCNVLWNNFTIGNRPFLESEGNITADPLFSAETYTLDAESPLFSTICEDEPEPPITTGTRCEPN